MLTLNARSTMKTCKDHLAAIKTASQDRWGDRWQLELVRSYVQILQRNGDEIATVNNRKTQIVRAFDAESCTADTLILLYDAIGYELSISRKLIP